MPKSASNVSSVEDAQLRRILGSLPKEVTDFTGILPHVHSYLVITKCNFSDLTGEIVDICVMNNGTEIDAGFIREFQGFYCDLRHYVGFCNSCVWDD